MDLAPDTRPGDAADPAAAPDRVHVLMRPGGNRDLLEPYLDARYDVTVTDDPTASLDGSDLCIVDDACFRDATDALRAHRADVEPMHYPVLLVTAARDDQPIAPSVWTHVDDVVRVPVRQAALDARIGNLLRQRQLSTRLAAKERALEATVDDLRLLERATDAAANGVTIVEAAEPTYPIVYANARFQALTGLALDGAGSPGLAAVLDGPAGDHPAAHLPDDRGCDGPAVRILDAMAAGEAVTETLVTTRADGTRFWNRVDVAPVRDDAGTVTHFVAFHTDVTRERVRTQRLGVLNRVLRHNLRNDLNVIAGYADLVHEREADPQVRGAMTEITQSASRLEQLGRHAGQIGHVLERLDHDDTVADAATLLTDRVATYRETYPGIDVSLSVTDGPWPVATTGLDAVLDELVDNAVTHADTPPTTITITAGPAPDSDDRVAIRVVDDGPGIPAGVTSVIHRGEETQLQHGDGLGLWLVHWVITLLGGTVEFTTTDGTTVTITLPVVDEA